MRMTEQQLVAFNSKKQGGQRRTQALGRMKSGNMNKTEAAYDRHLRARQIAGEVENYWFEGIGLRLASGCHYYPDFLVMLTSGMIEIHEVKARASNGSYRAEDDAKVKIKTIAEKYPFPLIVVWPKQGGAMNGWERMEL